MTSQLTSTDKKVVKGKLRTDLVPPEALEAMAKVFSGVSEKGVYPDRNWEQGIKVMTYYGAALRHLVVNWAQGIDDDPDYGCTHLEHALTNIAMMITCIKRGTAEDDRPKSTCYADGEEADILFQIYRIVQEFDERVIEFETQVSFRTHPEKIDYIGDKLADCDLRWFRDFENEDVIKVNVPEDNSEELIRFIKMFIDGVKAQS